MRSRTALAERPVHDSMWTDQDDTVVPWISIAHDAASLLGPISYGQRSDTVWRDRADVGNLTIDIAKALSWDTLRSTFLWLVTDASWGESGVPVMPSGSPITPADGAMMEVAATASESSAYVPIDYDD